MRHLQTLKKGGILRIKGPCSLTVLVRSGLIWATSAPANGDCLLEGDEERWLVSSGLIVLEALEESVVEIFGEGEIGCQGEG